jgi:hypothetical protein
VKAVQNISFSGLVQQPRNLAGEKKHKHKHKHKHKRKPKNVTAVEENFM